MKLNSHTNLILKDKIKKKTTTTKKAQVNPSKLDEFMITWDQNNFIEKKLEK
jgi:hypothetical protein